jgi:hypothetical protein
MILSVKTVFKGFAMGNRENVPKGFFLKILQNAQNPHGYVGNLYGKARKKHV